MSLIICVYVPTGIVLSGDSRTTLMIQQQPNPPAPAPAPVAPPAPAAAPPVPPVPAPALVQTNVTISDATHKVALLFGRFGVGTFGDAIINNLPVAHHIQQFEAQAANPPATTQQFGADLLQYFRLLNPVPSVGFIVAGYDGTNPFVFDVNVTNNAVQRVNAAGGAVAYGIVRGGDTDVVNRLLSHPQFNPLFDVMNLQDAVDYSRHLVRTSIDQMRFEPRMSTIGGPIDTLVINAAGASFLARKELRC